MQEFTANGIRVFAQSSKGLYNGESDDVRKIKEEMMTGKSDRHRDLENRMRDKRNVEVDIRKSFNKIILENG